MALCVLSLLPGLAMLVNRVRAQKPFWIFQVRPRLSHRVSRSESAEAQRERSLLGLRAPVGGDACLPLPAAPAR